MSAWRLGTIPVNVWTVLLIFNEMGGVQYSFVLPPIVQLHRITIITSVVRLRDCWPLMALIFPTCQRETQTTSFHLHSSASGSSFLGHSGVTAVTGGRSSRRWELKENTALMRNSAPFGGRDMFFPPDASPAGTLSFHTFDVCSGENSIDSISE